MFPLVLVCALALGGCPPTPVAEPPQFLAREQLLQRYNERAEAIQRLYSKCHIVLTMPTFETAGDGQRRVSGRKSYALDGNFVLRKPRDLYLEGRTLTTPMFGICSYKDEYRFWVKPEVSVEYYGRYDGPGAKRFFMRPDRLLEALAIFPVPADGSAVFHRGDATDVIQLLAPAGQGGAAFAYLAEEIHLDRTADHDPVEVRLYNSQGEPLIVSQLSDYQVVDGQRVPHRILMRFMAADAERSQQTVLLELSNVSLTRENKDAWFTRPPPSLDKHVNLDEPSPPEADAPRP